jgi:hypothetical protein
MTPPRSSENAAQPTDRSRLPVYPARRPWLADHPCISINGNAASSSRCSAARRQRGRLRCVRSSRRCRSLGFRIMIYDPKDDGTYVVEVKTAAGEATAISIPRTEAAVIRHFQERMPYGLFCAGSALK